jgi:haloacetate dehalogenase
MSSSDLADLFPGFASHWIDTSIGKMFARSGGAGPPLLLLHGYSQTNVMWHRVAPELARHFSLIIPDLPGYGWSVAPRASADHEPYSKRAMAAVMIEITLDIVPTHAMWHGMDPQPRHEGVALAVPGAANPLPEMLIAKAPVEYLEWKTASWTKARDLSAFDPRALAHYRAGFSDPSRIHAHCEDYRAGQTSDLAADERDHSAGKKIACPMLALWGSAGIPSETAGPLKIWREWADQVEGKPIDSGHFLAEENPQATAAALLAFFGSA